VVAKVQKRRNIDHRLIVVPYFGRIAHLAAEFRSHGRQDALLPFCEERTSQKLTFECLTERSHQKALPTDVGLAHDLGLAVENIVHVFSAAHVSEAGYEGSFVPEVRESTHCTPGTWEIPTTDGEQEMEKCGPRQ